MDHQQITQPVSDQPAENPFNMTTPNQITLNTPSHNEDSGIQDQIDLGAPPHDAGANATSGIAALLQDIGPLSPMQDLDDWSAGSNAPADFGPIPDEFLLSQPMDLVEMEQNFEMVAETKNQESANKIKNENILGESDQSENAKQEWFRPEIVNTILTEHMTNNEEKSATHQSSTINGRHTRANIPRECFTDTSPPSSSIPILPHSTSVPDSFGARRNNKTRKWSFNHTANSHCETSSIPNDALPDQTTKTQWTGTISDDIIRRRCHNLTGCKNEEDNDIGFLPQLRLNIKPEALTATNKDHKNDSGNDHDESNSSPMNVPRVQSNARHLPIHFLVPKTKMSTISKAGLVYVINLGAQEMETILEQADILHPQPIVVIGWYDPTVDESSEMLDALVQVSQTTNAFVVFINNKSSNENRALSLWMQVPEFPTVDFVSKRRITETYSGVKPHVIANTIFRIDHDLALTDWRPTSPPSPDTVRTFGGRKLNLQHENTQLSFNRVEFEKEPSPFAKPTHEEDTTSKPDACGQKDILPLVPPGFEQCTSTRTMTNDDKEEGTNNSVAQKHHIMTEDMTTTNQRPKARLILDCRTGSVYDTDNNTKPVNNDGHTTQGQDRMIPNEQSIMQHEEILGDRKTSDRQYARDTKMKGQADRDISAIDDKVNHSDVHDRHKSPTHTEHNHECSKKIFGSKHHDLYEQSDHKCHNGSLYETGTHADKSNDLHPTRPHILKKMEQMPEQSHAHDVRTAAPAEELPEHKINNERNQEQNIDQSQSMERTETLVAFQQNTHMFIVDQVENEDRCVDHDKLDDDHKDRHDDEVDGHDHYCEHTARRLNHVEDKDIHQIRVQEEACHVDQIMFETNTSNHNMNIVQTDNEQMDQVVPQAQLDVKPLNTGSLTSVMNCRTKVTTWKTSSKATKTRKL